MKGLGSLVFATASVAAIATGATAQPADLKDEATLGEIVVTARRRSESLQTVPQTVNALTADTLSKLNIQRFEDIGRIVPGLNLTGGQNGFQSSASLRGVNFQVESGSSATVQFYLNDAPVEANTIFQGMFDVGQVEVLRGPQGTTRGVAAPSGAITYGTRRPALSDYGAAINTTVGDLGGRNLQAAVNLPIVRDVLGVRFAGLLDQNDAGGVNSIFNPVEPRSVTSAFRTSISYEPADWLNADVMWQHLDRSLTTYTQVFGPGAPGGRFTVPGNPTPGVLLPRNYNGPPLRLEDRVAVQDEPSDLRQHSDVVTARLDSRLWGQHLSYVGSYSFFKIANRTAADSGNVIPGREIFNVTNVTQEATSHEIRLASDPAPGRFVDYTVGGFYSWTNNQGQTVQTAQYLPNVAGSPPNPANFNPNTRIPIIILSPSATQEFSAFGNLTFHLGEQTEVSVGGRQIVSSIDSGQQLRLGAPINRVQQDLARHVTERPFIYTASLSHRFNSDFMVYANTGTSWRRGGSAPGITNGANDPTLRALTFLDSESSRSYELGFKSTLLDGRARLNLAVYRQIFDGLIFTVPGSVTYRNQSSPTGPASTSTYNFSANADAVVEGFDLDAALQITSNWSLSAQLSYADGRVDDDVIPCNDSNFDGVADTGVVTAADFVRAGAFVGMCRTNTAISSQPYWNASIQSEYARPVRDGMDAFVRGLFSVYPRNDKILGFSTDPYNLLDLYAGLRSSDGAWEVAVFARNALENDTQTSGVIRGFGQDISGNIGERSGGSGYYTGALVQRREVGLNVRYAFGSR